MHVWHAVSTLTITYYTPTIGIVIQICAWHVILQHKQALSPGVTGILITVWNIAGRALHPVWHCPITVYCIINFVYGTAFSLSDADSYHNYYRVAL